VSEGVDSGVPIFRQRQPNHFIVVRTGHFHERAVGAEHGELEGSHIGLDEAGDLDPVGGPRHGAPLDAGLIEAGEVRVACKRMERRAREQG
jgi:hypothetical protein